MTLNPASNSPQTIVFDLGGVLAQISHSWEEAAAVAGVQCKNLGSGRTKLNEIEAFDRYQAASISLDDYLGELAKFVGCAPELALKVHNGILVVEYPGVKELVDELHGRGYRTGCLSNTNAPHWEYLAMNGTYPAIHSLQMKMASHLVGINKPDPRIFELYCERYDLDPGDIAFFDDYPVNVDSARRCGWNTRRIDPSESTPNQMRAYLAELGMISANAIA